MTAGDVVTVRRQGYEATYEVTRIIEKRVGAAIAVECYIDLTPADARPPRREPKNPFELQSGHRERGAGRPTKRERRRLDKFRGR